MVLTGREELVLLEQRKLLPLSVVARPANGNVTSTELPQIVGEGVVKVGFVCRRLDGAREVEDAVRAGILCLVDGIAENDIYRVKSAYKPSKSFLFPGLLLGNPTYHCPPAASRDRGQ